MDDQINSAYDELKAATIVAYGAGVDETLSKAALDIAKADGLRDGTITGKNPQMREASARGVLAEQYATYEATQEYAQDTKHQLSLARIEVERVRALLRLKELVANEQKKR